jgi:4-hydroxy-tetrahydrodipicolinate reductase
MTAIGIIGCNGRMGRAIRAELEARAVPYAGGVDKGEGDLSALVRASDVLIDFSSPAALKDNLEDAMLANTPIVIGTTGLEEAHHHLIDAAAHSIPVLQTGNMSLGVNLIAALVESASARLGDDWDIEIVEMHHRHKVDAPSGTALLLGEAAARGRGISLADHNERGRDGITGARARGAIGFAALRGGSVAGDHHVIFATDDERIEIGHRAENRAIFARGAVKAALWLVGQGAGRYDMKSVLGL